MVLGGPWVEPTLAHRQAMRHEKRRARSVAGAGSESRTDRHRGRQGTRPGSRDSHQLATVHAPAGAALAGLSAVAGCGARRPTRVPERTSWSARLPVVRPPTACPSPNRNTRHKSSQTARRTERAMLTGRHVCPGHLKAGRPLADRAPKLRDLGRDPVGDDHGDHGHERRRDGVAERVADEEDGRYREGGHEGARFEHPGPEPNPEPGGPAPGPGRPRAAGR